jgi:hypothetical protein
MGRFAQMLDNLERVKSEGFDPTQETYMERMKGSPNMPPDKKRRIAQELNAYLSSEQGGAMRSGIHKSGDRLVLDKDMWEKNSPYIDKGKLNIDSTVVNDVERVGEDYVIDRGNASKLPESYFSGAVSAYDAVQNSGLKGSGEFARGTGKQGEANLRHTIWNEIPDEKIDEWGTTRPELEREFVDLPNL